MKALAAAHPAVTSYQYDLAFTYNNKGNLLSDTGRQVEAPGAYREALAIQRTLVAANPNAMDYQVDLAKINNNIGNRYWDSGQRVEALRAFQEAAADFQELVAKDPTISQYRRSLAIVHGNIGRVFLQSGEPAEALTSYEAARTITRKLAAERPGRPVIPACSEGLRCGFPTVGVSSGPARFPSPRLDPMGSLIRCATQAAIAPGPTAACS